MLHIIMLNIYLKKHWKQIDFKTKNGKYKIRKHSKSYRLCLIMNVESMYKKCNLEHFSFII